MDIMEQAQQLGQAILVSPEHKNFQAAKEAMENSEEASKLLNELQAKRQSLHESHMSGGDVQERAQEFQAHQMKMLENKEIAAYLEAKSKVDELLAAVNRAIAHVTGMETGRKQGGCGGNCGSDA